MGRLGRLLLLGGLVFAAMPAASALADTTVGPLTGNGGFASNPRSASSSCPTGTVVTGLHVGQESRGYIGSVAVICTAPDGTVTTGSAIGDTGFHQSTASCSGANVGLGIYGYTGNIVDGIGIRCGTVGGTVANGPLVWRGSGGPKGPYDCPTGSTLTGLTGTYARYFGEDTVVTVTGVCSAVVPTTKAQCKHGGWKNFGTLFWTAHLSGSFKNQGDCVSYVATRGKNPPSGPSPGHRKRTMRSRRS